MDISIDGWGEVLIALIAVTVFIFIGFITGVVWARKRRNKAQSKSFKAERAELNGHRRELDQRELGLDNRKRELDRRDGAHDDVWRDQMQKSAELDQREAAIVTRERAFATRPSPFRGW